MRAIHAIAKDIKNNWKKPYFGAMPYLDAMQTLNTIEDNFYYDDAKTIINYFLANASTFRGDKAKELKAELKQLVK